MEYVERLVKAGVDPNETDYSKRTPLHVVAADGTAKDVEFLVHKGADVLVKDRYATYPPHIKPVLHCKFDVTSLSPGR